MYKKLQLLFAMIMVSATSYGQATVPVSKDLLIETITPNTLECISYMHDATFGRVACNGLIYINGKEALVIDTPPSDKLSKKLLDWFAVTYPGVTITGVIINHFHKDCLGGLNEFHRRGIKSYANKMTAELAARDGQAVPLNTFTDELKMKVGGARVVSRYFGEAHTKDNIVTWIPGERVLYGGCMIKSNGAGKGNIADANLAEWPVTVDKINEEFGKQVRIVVPGHGDYGGPELLSYTIALFDAE